MWVQGDAAWGLCGGTGMLRGACVGIAGESIDAPGLLYLYIGGVY